MIEDRGPPSSGLPGLQGRIEGRTGFSFDFITEQVYDDAGLSADSPMTRKQKIWEK